MNRGIRLLQVEYVHMECTFNLKKVKCNGASTDRTKATENIDHGIFVALLSYCEYGLNVNEEVMSEFRCFWVR